MKINFIILLLVFLSVCSFGQTQVFFNDTISPYEYEGGDFYHVFEHDSCYYIEGCLTNPEFKFFIKTAKDGTIIKKKKYDPKLIGFGGKYSNSVIQTDFGFVCATTVYDTLHHYKSVIMAIDFNLDTIWTKTYPYNVFSNYTVHNSFADIKETLDGGFIVSGHYFDTNDVIYHPFLMKIDQFGIIQWYKDYPSLGHCIFANIEICPDSGIIILADKQPPTSVIKTNALGTILWEKPLENTSTYSDISDMVYVGNNEYFIATNYDYISNSQTMLVGIHLCRINSNTGQIIMDTNHIPFHSFSYPKMHLHTLTNNRILVSATAYNPDSLGLNYRTQGVLLVYNYNGDSLGYDRINFGNVDSSNSWLHNLLIDSEGDFVGVGHYSNNSASTAWYFKKNPSVILSVNETVIHYENIGLQIFPNPTSDYFYIKSPISNLDKIVLYDIQGKIAFQQEKLFTKEGLVKLNVKGLMPGLYILKVSGSDENYFGKILIRE